MVEQKKADDDRNNRDNNIVIHRVAESHKADNTERIKDDSTFFSGLCEEALGLHHLKIKTISRVGTKESKDGKTRSTPRPLIVCFDKKEDKIKVMSSLAKLKHAEPHYKQISITHDYNKDERERIREKVAEAHKQNEEEISKNYVFRVRGPPGNLRIVRFNK